MRNLYRVYLVIFLITVTKGTMNVVFPPFLESRAFVVSQIGVLSSLFAVFQLAARLPSGILYSARNARWSLVIGLLVLGATALGFSIFEHLVPLAAMIILNGFAFGIITTVALALCIDAKPPDYPSGSMMGWYTSAIAAGYSVGQPVGGTLADRFGFAGAFVSTAAFSLLAILIILSLTGLGQPVAGKVDPLLERKTKTRWRLSDLSLRNLPVPVLLATSIVFFLNLMYRSVHTFFPLYALAAGITLSQLGFLRSILSLSAALVRPFSGRLFQIIHHRNVTHVAMITAAVSVVMTTVLTGSMYGLFLLFMFMGISRGLLRVTSATYLAEGHVDEGGGRVGIWSGIYNAGLDLGSIVGPAVGGVIASVAGIPTMLIVIPALTLGIYTAIAYIERQKRSRAAAVL